MTLTELLPEIWHLSAADKLKLIRILAEDFGPTEDISPLTAHKVYYLPTPYAAAGAGLALMAAMESGEGDHA